MHYYPFGMLMEGIGTAAVTQNKYRYNGKELNEDFGLSRLDYGKRWYDPSIGRFPTIDPLADTFNFVTPYNYAENEPVAHIDLWGLQKLKPNMQPIEKPGDLLSMKMLNNLWECVKTAGREFLTEPVGEMIKEAGDAASKAGVVTSAAMVPEVGGPMVAIGTGMEVAGNAIIVADKALSNEKIRSKTKTGIAIDVIFDIIPKPVEKALESKSLDKVVKETVKNQVRLLNVEDSNKKKAK
jgi:RHS repeat-associated protein